MGLSAGNLLSRLPQAPLADETVETLFERPGFRIERIVSTGQATPDGRGYDQETDEWVLVVEGSARLRIEGEAAAISSVSPPIAAIASPGPSRESRRSGSPSILPRPALDPAGHLASSRRALCQAAVGEGVGRIQQDLRHGPARF